MPDEYATRKDLDGLGGRLGNMEVCFARFQGCVENGITTIQGNDEIQFEKIKKLESDMHELEIGMIKMRDDLISKLSVRLSLIIGSATVLIVAIQVASMLTK